MSEKNYRERISDFRSRNKGKLVGVVLILIILIAIVAGMIKFQELAIGLIFLLIIVAVMVMFYGKASVRELFRKKRVVLDEMKLIEEKFFKRKILEEDFRKMMEKKQAELIKIDAKIAHSLEEKKLDEDERKILKHVTAKKQHYLKELLEEKDCLVREKNLIIEKFHKRKLDQKAFEELMAKNQSELIEVEAKIKSIYSEENIDNTLKDLKTKLVQLKQETVKTREEKIQEIATELVEKDRAERERQIAYEESKK